MPCNSLLILVFDTGQFPVRLTGGGAPYKGILEIFVRNQWGTVCNDYFGEEEATVACSQLGYTKHVNYFPRQSGSSSQSIWMDDVNCSFSEAKISSYQTRLADCAKRDSSNSFRNGNYWGIHNCGHSEDIELVCNSSGT